MNKVHYHKREHEPTGDRKIEKGPNGSPKTNGRSGGLLFGLGVSLLIACALAFGVSRSYSQRRAVLATAEQFRDFVPSVRVATVTASPSNIVVSLPATTAAFVDANIYARATGYIESAMSILAIMSKQEIFLRCLPSRNLMIRFRKTRRRLSNSRRRWSKRKPAGN
jgi:hypothetical protein